MKLGYAKALPSAAILQGKIYARIYSEGKDYLDRTAYVIADSITAYISAQRLQSTQNVITIDGLKGGETRQVGKVIRRRGVCIDKLRGAKDDNSVMIRLADSIAGLLRNAYEGDKQFTGIVDNLKKKVIITDI